MSPLCFQKSELNDLFGLTHKSLLQSEQIGMSRVPQVSETFKALEKIPGSITCTSDDETSTENIGDQEKDEGAVPDSHCVALIVVSVLATEPEESYGLVYPLCLITWTDSVNDKTISQVNEIIEAWMKPKRTATVENVCVHVSLVKIEPSFVAIISTVVEFVYLGRWNKRNSSWRLR